MHVHCLQHVPHEGPAGVAEWAQARGHDLSHTRLFADESLPDPDAIDALVVMGGPMSVHDEDTHEWLTAEKAYISTAIEERVHVLGICLGAQLVAEVLGGRVTEHDHREIGWYPIEATDAARAWYPTAALPDRFPVVHWHGDRFTIPPDGERLYRSEACENQAFHVGDRVAGFQCHPEATAKSVRALVEATDVDPGPWVQDPETLVPAPERFDQLETYCRQFLDAFFEG
ncbi:MAG: type 1 glutamine amidotransferase [Halococcoides sp.]